MNQEEILTKILALESVKKDIEEQKREEPDVDELLRLDYAITNFLDQDYETISTAIPDIWTWLQTQLREEFEDKTSDAKTFDNDGMYWRPEDYANKLLDGLLGDLRVILRRRVGKTE